jgi:hypothetical protein
MIARFGELKAGCFIKNAPRVIHYERSAQVLCASYFHGRLTNQQLG